MMAPLFVLGRGPDRFMATTSPGQNRGSDLNGLVFGPPLPALYAGLQDLSDVSSHRSPQIPLSELS